MNVDSIGTRSPETAKTAGAVLVRVQLLIGLLLSAAVSSANEVADSPPARVNPTPVVVIPASRFLPFFAEGETEPGTVPAFEVEIHPVTNEQYLAFVRDYPEWKRGVTPAIFADSGYLASWPNSESFGDANPRAAVTRVSWFAATAYCESIGRALPSEAQWEIVGRASATSHDATRQSRFVSQILRWYSQPRNARSLPVQSSAPNLYGVFDMHSLVWEWVLDFNASLVSDDARQREEGATTRICGAGASAAQNPSDYAAFMRYAFRSSVRASYTVPNLGFRCARSLP